MQNAMAPRLLARCWLALLVCCGWVGRSAAQDGELPPALVLRFDASASALDQERIRQAVQRELAGLALSTSGSARAATLVLALTPAGDVQLTYEPERRQLTRTVPLTSSSDVAGLIAHVAGNLVRDEASALLSELAPAPREAPREQTPEQDAPPASPVAQPAPRAPGPHEPWALTILLGGATHRLREGHAVLTVQVSRRFGRWELGLAAEAAVGRTQSRLGLSFGPTGEEVGFPQPYLTQIQLKLPLSLDVDLFRREHGYLQLGAAAGYVLAGAFHDGHLSGSSGAVAVGARVTAGLALAEDRALLLRGSWGLWPEYNEISTSFGNLELDSFGSSVQLGYLIAF